MFEAPQDAAAVLILDLGILISLILMASLLDRKSAAARLLFGVTAATFILCYAAWRWHDTLPNDAGQGLALLWPYIFIFFETVAITYTLMSIAILIRFKDRSQEADRQEAHLTATGAWPAVDIFICTYNEPLEVIEKSVIPALSVDYPNVTVWVCDDTRRSWLRDYCTEVGAQYLTRPDNHGAKAGNLNNALRLTAESTNAPLILVLDADFAVAPNILRRTVGLFHDPKAAVVQTPQFFFNADPIQHNLMAAEAWVDDQRIFFDIFQPAKDAWGCAFCVGTSFVVRRDRVNEMGGFPQDAICEDINLTYSLMRYGYRTHWLNERLSAGLSAEGLPEYVTQRTRWCLGTIQVALLKNGPFLGRGYSLMERIHYLHGVLNWLCKPFIVLMLAAPSVYWLLDVPAFQADYLSFMRYGVPALLALWVYSGWVSGKRTLPLFMEVTHIMTALAITITLVSAAIRPFGRPFKVTDKGGDRTISTVRWRMAAGFGSIALLSGASILWSFISPYGATEIAPIDFFNLVWAGVAMLFSFVAFLVCFERPRAAERFAVNEPSQVSKGNDLHDVILLQLGMETAQLQGALPEYLTPGSSFRLWIEGTGWVEAQLEVTTNGRNEVRLNPNPLQRRTLILRLFTTGIDAIARNASLSLALRRLAYRCFRAA
ncbi:glycosyltransferase family 2 protein [Methylobacterium phyllosphaerae]